MIFEGGQFFAGEGFPEAGGEVLPADVAGAELPEAP